MTALPSFVELMASLGLGGPEDALESTKLSVRHSRSSSHSSTASALSAASSSNVTSATSNIYSLQQRQLQHKQSSPSIVVSSHEGSPERDLPQDFRRSRATTRYSPYGSISHSRKASMPILNAERTLERPARALSTSPRLSPISASFRGRRSRRPDNLNLSDADLMGYTPISSYLRRKTPQNSPTSPTFARDRGTAVSHPLTIPALPTLLSPASFATQSSDSEEDEMDAIPDPGFKLCQPPHISSASPPWQSRYCEPAVSPRITICAPLSPEIAPVA
ncbi:hypothetical protein DICSQDRAFT_135227 [Dichomitus squalens LYAD-421 SS1]|uniref:uncharacterized protein n=1 Tax=Dichomitus squalens (strain LYAD-421) TaxID=732165 RepID=UPI0004415B32|nr:uncharacterized protein DICSQDRAFT_135227 [Dichomitus squalens LYAD-421 SS1]EJF62969.1 hypothetical protein DICSQDRAFT_135227 [Dichomitus squalens LYAD-421 SS1]